MFCLKYPPSCSLSPSNSLAHTGALLSETASGKQGVALPGDTEWPEMGSTASPPTQLGTEGLAGAALAHKNLTEESPACWGVCTTPGTGGQGPRAVSAAGHRQLGAWHKGGDNFCTMGTKNPAQPSEDPAARGGYWKEAGVAGTARRTAQILDCWHPAGRSSHPAQAEPLCFPLERETSLESHVLAQANVLVTERAGP